MHFDGFVFCITMALFHFIRDYLLYWKSRQTTGPKRLGYLWVGMQCTHLTHIWAAAAVIIGALK
jgi:hypothetical protein